MRNTGALLSFRALSSLIGKKNRLWIPPLWFFHFAVRSLEDSSTMVFGFTKFVRPLSGRPLLE